MFTLDGSEHAKPIGETGDARKTVPLNPLIGDIVIVEEPVIPAGSVMLAGLATILKSWTLNVIGVLWARETLVPVTTTV